MATSKRELTSLGLLPEIKANYTAATRASAEHVRHAFATVRLIEEALPGIPHGEQEDFIAVKVGCPLTTYKRWRGFWRQYQALPESSTVDDLTSFEDIKRLSPPKPKPAPKQDASNTVDATPKPEQDAPDEEPAASDTDDTDVSTDDAGSVYDDTDLDSALGGPTDLNPTKQVEPTDVECSRCKGSGRVPITAKMPACLAESPEFINSWQDYQLHRIQKKSSLTTIAISRLFKKLEAWGPTRAIKALEHTMEKGWAGVREDNDKPSPATEKKGRAAMEFTE
jgi:hypothetical protein